MAMLILMAIFLTSCSGSGIEYKNRKYLGPPDVYALKELQQKFGSDIEATGEMVDGLHVVETKEAIQILKEQHTVPTLLILKKNDSKYLVFSLSGGP
jgi:hypothetical protein